MSYRTLKSKLFRTIGGLTVAGMVLAGVATITAFTASSPRAANPGDITPPPLPAGMAPVPNTRRRIRRRPMRRSEGLPRRPTAVSSPGRKLQLTALTATWPPKRMVRSRVSSVMGIGTRMLRSELSFFTSPRLRGEVGSHR